MWHTCDRVLSPGPRPHHYQVRCAIADDPKSDPHINAFMKKLRMVHLFVRSRRCVPNSPNVSSLLILSGKLVGYTITDNVTSEQVSSAATPITGLGLIPLYIDPVVYMTTVGILFPCLTVIYLYTCSGRATHSVPDFLAPDPRSLAEPYECCSDDGGFKFCVKDSCKMRWKPPGTHHCSTCGICRIGFDHHCPWVRVVQHFSTHPLIVDLVC